MNGATHFAATNPEPDRPLEQVRDINARQLTWEQERRLCEDYRNDPLTNCVTNRRDYAGPRWPWLTGEPA